MYTRLHYSLCVLLRLRVILHLGSCASPVDYHATAETRHLYKTIWAYANNPNKIMFGQQLATAEGCSGGHTPYRLGDVHNGHQSWAFTDSQRSARSADELRDINDVTGQYPAVIGFDLGDLSDDHLLTTGWLIKKAHEKGLIVTLSWHQPDPVTATEFSFYVRLIKQLADIQHIIKRMLPNGDLNHTYKTRLDIIADWLHNLTDSSGKPIPLLFRPYHEMNGGSFWWGTGKITNNTAADYKHLFQYTVKYLRDTKHVHSLLYAFSPNKVTSTGTFHNFYPGDSFVDVVGIDFYYQSPFQPSTHSFLTNVRIMQEVAAAHGKVTAITEVGIQNNGIELHPQFWTDHVLSPLKSGNGTTKVAYMLAWSNFCTNRYNVYGTYKGHVSASYFRQFFNDDVMVFGRVMNDAGVIIG